jgi:amino acid permease
VSLLVAFSYPILAHPGRSSVLGLWRSFDTDEDAWMTHDKFRYTTVTAGLLGCSLVVAMFVTDLGLIFSFVGATAATMISFILPGAAYYSMHERQGPAWKRYGALGLVVMGCIITPVCTAFIFI